MHEMGVVLNIVSAAEEFAKKNNASKVVLLVLQIGELSAVLPQYVEYCYPGAIENTMLSEAKLVIERIPGNGFCPSCSKVYNLIEHNSICPRCGCEELEILSGKDVIIKEIGVI